MLVALTMIRYVENQVILWVAAVAAFVASNVFAVPWPFAQWFYVWPAVVVAATNQYKLGAILFLAAIFSPFSDGAVQSFLAIVMIMIARIVRLPAFPWVSYLSGLSLGIYLVHPLAASITSRLLGDIYFLPTIAGTIFITIVLKVVLPKVV